MTGPDTSRNYALWVDWCRQQLARGAGGSALAVWMQAEGLSAELAASVVQAALGDSSGGPGRMHDKDGAAPAPRLPADPEVEPSHDPAATLANTPAQDNAATGAAIEFGAFPGTAEGNGSSVTSGSGRPNNGPAVEAAPTPVDRPPAAQPAHLPTVAIPEPKPVVPAVPGRAESAPTRASVAAGKPVPPHPRTVTPPPSNLFGTPRPPVAFSPARSKSEPDSRKWDGGPESSPHAVATVRETGDEPSREFDTPRGERSRAGYEDEPRQSDESGPADLKRGIEPVDDFVDLDRGEPADDRTVDPIGADIDEVERSSPAEAPELISSPGGPQPNHDDLDVPTDNESGTGPNLAAEPPAKKRSFGRRGGGGPTASFTGEGEDAAPAGDDADNRYSEADVTDNTDSEAVVTDNTDSVADVTDIPESELSRVIRDADSGFGQNTGAPPHRADPKTDEELTAAAKELGISFRDDPGKGRRLDLSEEDDEMARAARELGIRFREDPAGREHADPGGPTSRAARELGISFRDTVREKPKQKSILRQYWPIILVMALAAIAMPVAAIAMMFYWT